MATRAEKTETPNKPQKPKHSFSGPAGWTQVTAENCLNFWQIGENRTVQGILLGMHERKGDQKGFYYQLELTEPCSDVIVPAGNGADFVPGSLEPGDLINVDARSAISNLAQYANDNPGGYEVCVWADENIKIKGNRTFWRMKAFVNARS